jgi:hypothetical protein
MGKRAQGHVSFNSLVRSITHDFRETEQSLMVNKFADGEYKYISVVIGIWFSVNATSQTIIR